jgi:hypothetical protein
LIAEKPDVPLFLSGGLFYFLMAFSGLGGGFKN